VPAGTLRLSWLRLFRAFSSVLRQMSGYNSQRRGTASTLPKMFELFCLLFVLCRSVYCLCVNVYCTPATGRQPNCSFNKYIMFRLFEWKLEIWTHELSGNDLTPVCIVGRFRCKHRGDFKARVEEKLSETYWIFQMF